MEQVFQTEDEACECPAEAETVRLGIPVEVALAKDANPVTWAESIKDFVCGLMQEALDVPMDVDVLPCEEVLYQELEETEVERSYTITFTQQAAVYDPLLVARARQAAGSRLEALVSAAALLASVAAAPRAGSGCTAALASACGAKRSDVFACAQCAGDHQQQLQARGELHCCRA